MHLQEDDVRKALEKHGGEESRWISQDPKMFKYTFDLLKAIAQDSTSKQMLGGASAVAGVAKLSSQYYGSKQAQDLTSMAALSMSVFKLSMDMTTVAKLTSPAAVGLYVTAATIQKAGLMVSVIPDDKKAKCVGAVLELAGSLVVTGLTAPTGILLVLSVAALTSSALSTNNSCKQYYPNF